MSEQYKVEIVVNSKGAESNVDSFSRSMRGAGKEADNTAFSLNGVAKAIAGVIAAGALGDFFIQSTNAAKKFNAAISNLSAITGAVGRDLENLRNIALEFGQTTTLSASEAAEALKLVASAKPDLLENAAALKEVTKQAILLSEASGADLASSAATVGKALNQFGAEADQAARFVNVLAAGAKFGSSEIIDTAEALKASGVAANDAKISFEETNAAIQVLAKTGIQGAEAGTALRNIFLKLENGADKTLRPSIVGVAGAIDNLNKKNLDGAALTKMFGLENIVAAKTLLNNSSLIGDLTTKLTGTNTALEQATTNTNNWEGDLKALNSAVETIQIKVGSLADGELRTLTQAITGMLQAVGGNEDALKEWGSILDSTVTLAESLAVVLGARLITAMTTYIGTVYLSIAAQTKATFTTNAYGQVVSRTTALTNAATLATKGLSGALALLGGPLGIAITAAAAVIYFYQTAETAKERSERLADEVDNLADSFKGLTDAQRQVQVSKLNTEMGELREQLIKANSSLNNWIENAKTDPFANQQVKRYKNEVEDLNTHLDALSIKQQALFKSGTPNIATAPSAAAAASGQSSSMGAESASAIVDEKSKIDPQYSQRYADNEAASTSILAQELQNRRDLFYQYTVEINAAQDGSFEQERLRLYASQFEQVNSSKINLQNKLNSIEEERILLLENDQITADARASVLASLQEQELIAKETYEQSLTEISADGADARLRIAEAERSYNLSVASGAFSDLLGLAAGHSRKAFELAKVGAISTAVITGYDAAVKAWDSGMSTGGPWAPVVAAGYTAASLLKTGSLIAGIKGQSYGGGGSQSGGSGGGLPSVSVPSGTPTSTGAPSAPTAAQDARPQRTINISGLAQGEKVSLDRDQLLELLSGDDDVNIAISNGQANAARIGAI